MVAQNLELEIRKKLQDFDVIKIEIAQKIKIQIRISSEKEMAFQKNKVHEILKDLDISLIFVIEKNKKKPSFKKIIGVTSGKGGVGKSSVSLHLAFALRDLGFKVGILDADIYGPSIPILLNLNQAPEATDDNLIKPIKSHGMEILSMGLFLKENQAALWRGPMLNSAFTQLLEQADWQCDYLIIDFPPGTGDIHMSCSKLIPEIQILLVTTPQRVAFADVFRMIITMKTLNLEIVGLVENMVGYECQKCGCFEEFIKNKNYEGKLIENEISKLAKLPIWGHWNDLNETGYPEDFKQNIEKNIFQNLATRFV